MRCPRDLHGLRPDHREPPHIFLLRLEFRVASQARSRDPADSDVRGKLIFVVAPCSGGRRFIFPAK